MRDSGGLAINSSSLFFLQRLLSKLQVLLLMVMFVVTILLANWYIFHKFSGDLLGTYPFPVGTNIFPHCLLTISSAVFLFEALFRLYTSGALFYLVGPFDAELYLVFWQPS
jgi:hypothetical protein